jgi:hypothetical protein
MLSATGKPANAQHDKKAALSEEWKRGREGQRKKKTQIKNKGADLELERREYLRRILYPNDLRLLPLDDGKSHCCLRSNKTNRLSARRKERKQGKKARWGQEAI